MKPAAGQRRWLKMKHSQGSGQMVQRRLSSRFRKPHRFCVCPTVIWGSGGQHVHFESWPTRSRCSSLLALVCPGCMYSSMTEHSTSAPRELHLPGAAISGGGAELPWHPIQSRSCIVERGALLIHNVSNTRVPSHSNTVGGERRGTTKMVKSCKSSATAGFLLSISLQGRHGMLVRPVTRDRR